MAGDRFDIGVKETLLLEKYDGDPADGKLFERLTVVDGKVVKTETFDKEVN